MTEPTRTAVEAGTVAARPGVGGMPSRHLFTPENWQSVNPFLYMVHFGPRDIRETDWGFGPHPHRGFETITYMLDGALEHRDSFGGAATLGPGDMQWMTAGAGIVHSEMPPDAFVRQGGIVEGFQIWLNLPLRRQRVAPNFQVLPATERPVARLDGGTVRVLAGAVHELQSPIATQSDVLLAHISLLPGAAVRLPCPLDQTALAYRFKGPRAGSLLLWQEDGDLIELRGHETDPEDVLILAGARLEQDVVSHGPFVMSSHEDIKEAILDYNAGRLGTPAQRTDTAGAEAHR